jgi:serine/threonine kinase 32
MPNFSNAAAALEAAGNPEDRLPLNGTNAGTGSASLHSRQMSQSNSQSGTSPPNFSEKSFPNPNIVPGAPGSVHDEENVSPSSQVRPSVTSAPSPVSQNPGAPSFSRPLPPLPANYRHQRGATRKMSKSGGVQMVLEETGSWSELADQSSTLPAEGYEALISKGQKPPNSGMLSFLSRKKGRERSPKPTEPGVLGKEGARHIISS